MIDIYGFGALSKTHSTDPGGQDHPAPLDEKDGFVANHVFNVHVEPVATCSANKNISLCSYLKLVTQFMVNISIIIKSYNVKSCIFCGIISNALHVFASVHQQRAERKSVYIVPFFLLL